MGFSFQGLQTLVSHWGGGTGIAYLLRDQFNTASSAPLTSPRTAEPGPGTLTLVQNDGQFSISDGKLNFPAQSTFAWNAQALYTAITRASGRIIAGRLEFTSRNVWIFGYGNNATSTTYDDFSGSSNEAYYQMSPLLYLFTTQVNNVYDLGVILLAAGAYMIQRRAGNSWVIHYIVRTNTQASGAGRFTNGLAAGTLDNFIIGDLADAKWSTAYGAATSYVASPSDGEIIITTSESLIEFTWTPSAGQTLELRFLRVDDNNCYLLRCSQADGTIKLYNVLSGVETELDAGKTQTWTASTAYRIVVKHHETSLRSYVANVVKHAYTGGVFNPAGATAKAAGFTTGADFASTPYRITLPSLGFADVNYFLAYGDSKTWGSGDTGTNGTNGYPPDLAALTGYTEMPPRANLSGYTTVTAQPVVDANIKLNSGYAPKFCLLNLGTNDAFTGTSEADFKTNYGYIIDAMNAKWPDARIGVMRPWRIAHDEECDAIASWIADLVAARSYCFLGPDERVFLENGDNGATYTDDGVHPNDAGYLLTAQQWKITMGL